MNEINDREKIFLDFRNIALIPKEERTYYDYLSACSVAYHLVNYTDTILTDMPIEYQTEELLKILLSHDGYSLRYVVEEMMTKQLCRIAVNCNGTALEYVPLHLRDYEMCYEAVLENGLAIQFVPNELYCEDLVIKAIRTAGNSLNMLFKEHIPDKFKTRNVCIRARIGRVDNALIPKV